MLSDFLVFALAFIVAIGIIVTVHEFGHFWVARRVGVKVLRFSIGFGRPIWTRRGHRVPFEGSAKGVLGPRHRSRICSTALFSRFATAGAFRSRERNSSTLSPW